MANTPYPQDQTSNTPDQVRGSISPVSGGTFTSPRNVLPPPPPPAPAPVPTVRTDKQIMDKAWDIDKHSFAKDDGEDLGLQMTSDRDALGLATRLILEVLLDIRDGRKGS